jgi:hypothetical protein
VSPRISCFAPELGRLFGQASLMIDMVTPCTAARQLFGLSCYKAGQFQAPCSDFENVSASRPTNAAPNFSIKPISYSRPDAAARDSRSVSSGLFPNRHPYYSPLAPSAPGVNSTRHRHQSLKILAPSFSV